jgi:bifunctional UDP-N-acetylglucosamine pyrophosphorylase/glucosamine-1-phosphate N-acetyltransferase
MQSNLPKVLQPLAGIPMLTRVLDALAGAGFSTPTVVVGYEAERIQRTIGDRCRYVVQEEQRGTGDAARIALEALPESVERVLVVHGDEPLIPASTYREMLDVQSGTGAPIVLLTAHLSDTRGLGRVIRNARNEPIALLQEGELTSEQQTVDEINMGAYVFDAAFLRHSLPQLQPHPPKGEYYLTDVIAMAVSGAVERALPVAAVELHDTQLLGVNDLVQLEGATREVYRRTNRRLMESGVRIVDSSSVYISDDVDIAPDTVIHPFSTISGPTRIGARCVIGPGSHISASSIGDDCTVLNSTIEESIVEDAVLIGPYAHLRPGSAVGTGVEIGNYAEIKASSIGARTKMHHMSYVGDACIGADVNISAGTVTCNYDGVSKQRTIVEDGAFIGSDTMLRAPLTVGRGAYTGAGSVVVRDVEPYTVVAGVPARVLRTVPHEDERASDDLSEVSRQHVQGE